VKSSKSNTSLKALASLLALGFAVQSVPVKADPTASDPPGGALLAAGAFGGWTINGLASGPDAGGDVILRARFHPTDSPSDFSAAVDQGRHAGRKFISRVVDHGARRQYAVLKLGDNRG
jgi:hypothetical protein